MTKAKILVIEDADALRKDIMEMLRFEDFLAFGAANGMEGVEVARKTQPDLIICDIMMPEMDGYGVLKTLQRDGDGVTVPFIFLTAKTDKSDVRFGMESGADDYVPKPFTAAELIGSVRRQLEKRIAFNKASDDKLDELRENIILSLPHEIRTPLTGILGFSDILMTESATLETEKIVEMAHYIRYAAHRLYHLTENYLVYAQLEVLRRDRENIAAMSQFTTESPEIVIEDAAIEQAQIYSREADLVMLLDDHGVIQALEDNVKKIVEELVNNAFKFSLPGTVVRVEGRVRGEFYELRVTDYGRGMTRQQISHIGAFVQFGRLWHEQQGSGFGLAIVQRAVELHQGEFEIDSEVDRFTTVTVRLPIVKNAATV